MVIKKYNISELIPANYNPRKELTADDKEYQKIKTSIKTFGYVDPIIINKDKTIIGGHQRLNVLRDLGYTDVNVIEIDIDKTKEKALNVALNKITGEWDIDKLGVLLNELKNDNFDLDITGFDADELVGVLFNVDDLDDTFELPDGDKSEICQMTFTLHQKQKELIEYAIGLVKDEVSETFGNSNSNGNSLYEVIRQWSEQKK